MLLTGKWILVECQALGEEVIGSVHARHAIPNGQAIWWACPACRGWHVIIIDNQEQSLEMLPGMYPRRVGQTYGD